VSIIEGRSLVTSTVVRCENGRSAPVEVYPLGPVLRYQVVGFSVRQSGLGTPGHTSFLDQTARINVLLVRVEVSRVAPRPGRTPCDIVNICRRAQLLPTNVNREYKVIQLPHIVVLM